MCSRTTCRNCGKPTWSGCGEHIEQALHGVPKADRCSCDKNAKSTNTGGFFHRILGGN